MGRKVKELRLGFFEDEGMWRVEKPHDPANYHANEFFVRRVEEVFYTPELDFNPFTQDPPYLVQLYNELPITTVYAAKMATRATLVTGLAKPISVDEICEFLVQGKNIEEYLKRLARYGEVPRNGDFTNGRFDEILRHPQRASLRNKYWAALTEVALGVPIFRPHPSYSNDFQLFGYSYYSTFATQGRKQHALNFWYNGNPLETARRAGKITITLPHNTSGVDLLTEGMVVPDIFLNGDPDAMTFGEFVNTLDEDDRGCILFDTPVEGSRLRPESLDYLARRFGGVVDLYQHWGDYPWGKSSHARFVSSHRPSLYRNAREVITGLERKDRLEAPA